MKGAQIQSVGVSGGRVHSTPTGISHDLAQGEGHLHVVLPSQGCDILTQSLIGLIEYSYYQGMPSFLKAHL
jgi:hypothetical protein